MASFAAIQNEGFTVISNSLLRYYPSLKISEIEAMLLLQLESFKQANNFFPVSYTHLRAHETLMNLVCRLLLEKKNQSKEKMH